MFRAWIIAHPVPCGRLLGAGREVDRCRTWRVPTLGANGSFVGASREKVKTGFGRQRIEAHVPGIGAHGVRSLAPEAEPDQSRTHPVPAVAPELESSIVESAAHSQAATRGIDADQRHDDQIEPARRDRPAAAVRHRNAEHSAPRLSRQWAEAQPAVTPVADHRNENADPPPPCGDQQRGGVRLRDRTADKRRRARPL